MKRSHLAAAVLVATSLVGTAPAIAGPHAHGTHGKHGSKPAAAKHAVRSAPVVVVGTVHSVSGNTVAVVGRSRGRAHTVTGAVVPGAKITVNGVRAALGAVRAGDRVVVIGRRVNNVVTLAHVHAKRPVTPTVTATPSATPEAVPVAPETGTGSEISS